ncbi:hypothetical protein KAR48_18125 [bacterium]|nr:hypothetical protein [bacterium]
MADTTTIKKVIEPWFRDEYLQKQYPGAEIKQKLLDLIWGGKFEYDAVVYEDGELKVIYLLSCSEYKTKNGKGGPGKFNKIKSDTLMMLGTQAPKKIMAFFDKSMYKQFKTQQELGRLPQDILCELVTPNVEIASLIEGIRNEASREVTPTKTIG